MGGMTALHLLLTLAAEAPDAKDVKAGWVAFGLFLGGAAVVVLLGLSMRKQLRRVQANRDAGVFGDEPRGDASAEPDDRD